MTKVVNKKALKEYVSLKMDYELLKRSDLYKTDLSEYVKKSMDYCLKLKELRSQF